MLLSQVHYRKFKRHFISLLCIASLLCSSTWAAQNLPLGKKPNFNHLMLDGDSGVGSIFTIQQDHLGFLWFGGVAGLARFDGYRFHTYQYDRENSTTIPNNTIRDIKEDASGTLWIATDGGVVSYNRELDNFTRYAFLNKNGKKFSNWRINKIYFDEDNLLWLAGEVGGVAYLNAASNQFEVLLSDSSLATFSVTDILQVDSTTYLFSTIGSGVFLWDRATDSLEHFTHDPNNANSLPHKNIRSLFRDSNDRIWIGNGFGLSQFFPESKTFKTISLETVVGVGNPIEIWDIAESSDGLLWLSTDGSGITYLDPASKQSGFYLRSRSRKNSLSCDVVRTIFFDKNNDFWIGCYPGGVNHYDLSNTFFDSYTNFSENRNLSSATWSIEESKEGNLWIGTEENGLYYFDVATQNFSQSYRGIDFQELNISSTVLTIFRDSKENLWLGSWGQGLYKINFETKKVEQFRLSHENNRGFNAESIWRLAEDKQGNIWIATMHNGLFRYYPKEDRFKNYRFNLNDHKSINDDTIWSVHVSEKNNLWVATHRGFAIYNRLEDNFTRVEHHIENSNTLSHNWVQEIYEDYQGRVWVATYGGGLNLFDRQGRFIAKYGKKEGLASERIVGMVFDQEDNLWISSDKGLNRFNINSKSVRHFGSKNWLQGNIFYRGAYEKRSNGSLVFGGVNGFSLFDPNNIVENQYVTEPYLTELNMFNRVIKPTQTDSVLSKDILLTKSITLPYDQNSFSLSFTSLSYRGYDENLYSHYLDGFDSDWSPASPGNTASYTNLDPGIYSFYVKSSNNSGIWNTTPKKLEVIVLPNPWFSWWAYLIYVLLITSVLLWLYLSQRKQIENQRQVNNRLRELDQMKDEILANTSHELRTPLNGIIGLAEMIKDGGCGDQSAESLSNLSMIISSAKRLNNLVNDILDFSKVRNEQLVLNKNKVDIFALVAQVYYQTIPIVNQDEIDFRNEVPRNIGSIYADEDRILQILTNLIGNAVKYTRDGKIVVTAKDNGDSISISIEDSGIGIAPEFLDRIFSSFEQAPNSGVKTKSGTGLGLAITEKLVRLHGGKIFVSSVVDSGSTFTVELPKQGFECYTEEIKQQVTKEDKNVLLDSKKTVNKLENINEKYRIELFGREESVESVSQKLSEKNLGYHVSWNIAELIDSIDNAKLHVVLFLCLDNDIDSFQVIAKNLHTKYSFRDLTLFIVLENDEKIAPNIAESGVHKYLDYNVESDVIVSHIKNALLLVDQYGRMTQSRKTKRIDELSKPTCNLPFFTDRRGGENTVVNKKTILVVDDEMVNRMVLRHQLINADYDVYEAANGEQAVEAIEQGAFFDLILLDIMMPGISGYEVCQIIRRKFDMTELPIIFVSAKSQTADHVKALEFGGNDTLGKPVDAKLLFTKIETCLNFVSEYTAFLDNKVS